MQVNTELISPILRMSYGRRARGSGFSNQRGFRVPFKRPFPSLQVLQVEIKFFLLDLGWLLARSMDVMVGMSNQWYQGTNASRRAARGFTLIELLVVIAIIAIL